MYDWFTMNNILTYFSPLEWTLVTLLAVVLIYEIVFYGRYIAAVPRLLRRQAKVKDSGTNTMLNRPGCSVIVCARNEARNIRPYLQALLTQDYPIYEVIVVNDGSQDDTREAIEWYMVRDSRVRMTFVPLGAHVGSTKKLAITLGAKAAQYDYLLLTDADCRPESKHWISSMMAGFSRPGTDIVLGYGAYFREKSHLNRLIQFDTLFNGLHYLGMALAGRPYMGVGRNLAYRKEFFFESGGFSTMMTARSGDDDLFVNKTANRTNTTVVVDDDSLTWSLPKQSLREWMQQKRRHLSVSTRYTAASKLHLGLEPIVRGLFYALVPAMVILSVGAFFGCTTVPFCPWLGVAALGALVLRWAMQFGIMTAASRRMHQHRFGLNILYFDIILPLINLYIFITAPLYRNAKW